MKQLTFLIPVALLLLLAACENNNREKAIGGSEAFISDSVSITGLTGNRVKLVKTAALQCEVKDVHQGSSFISGLAREVGGMVSHQTITAHEKERKQLALSADSFLLITSYTSSAEMTLRIPVHNLESFLQKVVAGTSFTASSQMDVEDKSLAFLAAGLKKEGRIDALTRKQPAQKVDLATAVQVGDEAIDYAISNRQIDADVAYSTVQVALSQPPWVRKEVVVNTSLSNYSAPFGQKAADAFRGGWTILQDAIVALLHLWPIGLLALLGLGCRRQYRLRQRAVVR